MIAVFLDFFNIVLSEHGGGVAHGFLPIPEIEYYSLFSIIQFGHQFNWIEIVVGWKGFGIESSVWLSAQEKK